MESLKKKVGIFKKAVLDLRDEKSILLKTIEEFKKEILQLQIDREE